jgi:hypothetical protein
MQVEAAARGDVQPVQPNQALDSGDLYWNTRAISASMQEKARKWKQMFQRHKQAGKDVMEPGSSLDVVLELVTGEANALEMSGLTEAGINTLASTAPPPSSSVPNLGADVIEGLELWTASCQRILQTGGDNASVEKLLTTAAVRKEAAVSMMTK